MKTSRAVFITIFVMSFLNVLTFKHLGIPQGCFTFTCILTLVWLVFDVVVEGDHVHYYNSIRRWIEKW